MKYDFLLPSTRHGDTCSSLLLLRSVLPSLRTQAEMAHTCRGTIPLATAHIEVGDTCHLVLTSGGRSYHLKATSEGECQRWVSALQQAKANATLLMHHSGGMDQSHPVQTETLRFSTYSP